MEESRIDAEPASLSTGFPDLSRPLGIRLSSGLDGKQLWSLRILEAYDLTPVRDRLIKSETMPIGLMDEAIFEFRRYLGTRIAADRPVPMLSRQVDEVWHTCLLFTRLYADLCDRAAGYFIHHEPTYESDRHASWREFANAYRPLFGEPGSIWQIARPDF